MSGVKTTTISSYELERLRRQAASATSLAAANSAMNRLNSRLTDSMNAANTRINTLTNNLDRMTKDVAAARKDASNLRVQLQNTVKESNERLVKQAQQHQEQIREVRQDMAEAMAANNRRIEQVINENNVAVSNQIREVNVRVDATNSRMTKLEEIYNNAAKDAQNLLRMAQDYLDVARELNADSATYRYELLLPGKFEDVLAAATKAEEDIKLPGNEAVARNSARDAYREALEFHEALIQAEQAWTVRYQAAQQAVSAAQAQIEASREVKYEGTDVRVDVNYWSDGDLERLSKEAQDLQEQLEKEPNTLSMEDLQSISDTGEQVSAETLNSVAFAIGALECNQDRADAAQDLANELKERAAVRIVTHGYQNGDSRGAHRLHLRNDQTKFEMVITQTPVVKPDGTIEIQLRSDILNFGNNNAKDGGDIAREALQALEDLGYGSCTVDSDPDYETRVSDQITKEDLERWCKKDPETQVEVARPVHKPREKKPQTSTN